MIPILELIRLETSLEGTFGVLKINKRIFCVTLELPNRLNLRNMSCIPEQQYICQKYLSPTYGDTYYVKNVPNRSTILFHPGNLIENTEGCILIAEYFGELKEQRAILNSRKVFKEFMVICESHLTLHLTICNNY